MKYKIGDIVLVEAEIVDTSPGEPGYLVKTERGSDKWVYELEIRPMDSRTYEDGLIDGWETARRLFNRPDDGGFTQTELDEIFGCDWRDVINRYTAAEAAEKIREWKDRKQIHVGDVVRIDGCAKAVVTQVDENGDCQVLYSDGCTGYADLADIRKTGRSIDIAGLLAEIGGNDAE